jgi:hypothetical protein
MPSINLASDLIEVEMQPAELNTAQQLKDHDLSVMLLQNTRVGVVRQLAAFDFLDDKSEKDIRNHIFLRGKLAQLDEILDSAHNPTPIPVDNPSQ